MPPVFNALTPLIIHQMELPTTPPALALLHLLSLLPSPPPGTSILDVACGAGCVAKVLAREWKGEDGIEIAMTDKEGFLMDTGKAQLVEMGAWGRLNCSLLGPYPAQDLAGVESDRYTHVTFNFGPQMIPPPNDEKAFREIYRVLQPHGTIGFSIWTSPALTSLFSLFDLTFPPLPGQFTDPAYLSATLSGIGFTEIVTKDMAFQVDHPVDGLVDLVKTVFAGIWEKEGLEAWERWEKGVRGMAQEGVVKGLEWECRLIMAKKA